MTRPTPTARPVGHMEPAGLLTAAQRQERTLRATAPKPAATDIAWMLDSACHGKDPAIFQPIGEGPQYQEQIEQARTICAACPVRVRCGEYALATRQSSGIWASMTERDREQELRRRSRVRQRAAGS